jgi:glucosyl-3-phosphoglycerate synthase
LVVSIVVPHIGDPGRLGRLIRSISRVSDDVEIVAVLGTPIPLKIRGKGVKVIYQSILKYPGRGIAMRDGYYFSDGEVIVYIDSNTDRAEPKKIGELYRPILDGYADVVKAGFSRRFLQIEERIRKTLAKLYPGLQNIEHPLSPYIAAKKKALSVVEWESGWGADIAILIDTHVKGFRIAEIPVDLKERYRKPSQIYRESVEEIAEAIIKRGLRDGRISSEDADKIYKDIIGKLGVEI